MAVCLRVPPLGPGALPPILPSLWISISLSLSSLCLYLSLCPKCLYHCLCQSVFVSFCPFPSVCLSYHFFPSGVSLSISYPLSLRVSVPLCLPDFLWFLSLTLLPCFSLSPLPPIPFSSPPSTSLICQVSRDAKGGQACRAVRAWEAARPRAYSQRTEAGGRTPVPWEGSHLPLKASTLHTPC